MTHSHRIIVSTGAGLALLIAGALAPLGAFAQTSATMPALYNQSGAQVNNGNTSALPAGYYFLQTGAQGTQVYYYGNGTYYDPSTGVYGGSVSDANGTAGALLNYTSVGTTGTVSVTSPGVPNTGAGGNASMTWLALAISGAVLVGGASYLVMMARRSHLS